MMTTTENSAEPVYYGTVPCDAKTQKSGNTCTNFAYYRINGNGKREPQLRCGVHSRGKKRQKLPVDPNRQQKQAMLYKQRQELVEQAAKRNAPNPGQIIVSKMRMMKKPEHHDGFLKVFPNFRHGNRADGFGCASLSPKSLGPIKHGMPNLPAALNLENYHQAAKVYRHEMDPADPSRISDSSIELRKKMYADPVPHRHKFDPAFIKKQQQLRVAGNVNIPFFSVYYDKQGGEHRYTYLECRYFYCHWYEILAPKQAEFKRLCELRDQGYNLHIIGYDGYPVTDDLYQHYLDTSRPFGHELVLYSLLTIQDPADYPWNRYYREHREIYKDVI